MDASPSRLLGAEPDALTEADIQQLVTDNAPEGDELDLKRTLYGNRDGDRREFAGDVAAFANHRGGLLLLGIEEADGKASAAPGVALSEAEQRRMEQIAASLIFPHVPIPIHRIESAADPSQGWYAVSVAPSPNRPHAVRVGDALRYPRRDGTHTRYLTEGEVADLYRDRFGGRDELNRLTEIRDDVLRPIDFDGVPWVCIVLVPSGAGSLTIDRARLAELGAWVSRYNSRDPITNWLSGAHPIFHAFGRAEVSALCEDGTIRARHVFSLDSIRQWAEQNGVAMTEETVA